MLHARHVVLVAGQRIKDVADEKIPVFVADGQQWLHVIP